MLPCKGTTMLPSLIRMPLATNAPDADGDEWEEALAPVKWETLFERLQIVYNECYRARNEGRSPEHTYKMQSYIDVMDEVERANRRFGVPLEKLFFEPEDDRWDPKEAWAAVARLCADYLIEIDGGDLDPEIRALVDRMVIATELRDMNAYELEQLNHWIMGVGRRCQMKRCITPNVNVCSFQNA